MLPFAMNEFSVGQRATAYERWVDATEVYTVLFEDGYEPFLIMNRHSVPLYNEKFTGYGRNKCSFTFHVHALGCEFRVMPDMWIVHVPHERTTCYKRTIGERNTKRFEQVMALYRESKTVCTTVVQCTAFAASRKSGIERPLGYWPTTALQRLGLTADSMLAPLPAWKAAFWFRFEAPMPKVCWTFRRARSPFHRLSIPSCMRATNTYTDISCSDSLVTLVTHLSHDRLGRLERLCASWEGPLVAVVTPANSGLTSWVQAFHACRRLHSTIGTSRTMRFDFILTTRPRGIPGRSPLYPANALRNIGVSAVTTDFVLLLDVDLVPSLGLHRRLNSAACEQLLRSCTSDTFFVVPAFEWAASRALPEDNIANLTPSAVRHMFASGDLIPFHQDRYPAGHGPTSYATWVDPAKGNEWQYPIFYQEVTLIPPPPLQLRQHSHNQNTRARARLRTPVAGLRALWPASCSLNGPKI